MFKAKLKAIIISDDEFESLSAKRQESGLDIPDIAVVKLKEIGDLLPLLKEDSQNNSQGLMLVSASAGVDFMESQEALAILKILAVDHNCVLGAIENNVRIDDDLTIAKLLEMFPPVIEKHLSIEMLEKLPDISDYYIENFDIEKKEKPYIPRKIGKVNTVAKVSKMHIRRGGR